MEELFRVSKEYYRTCKDIFLFGNLGFILIFSGLPFLLFSMHLSIRSNGDKTLYIVLLQATGGVLWGLAKRTYNRNLINRLSTITHLNSDNLQEQKTAYLQSLTADIGANLFTSLKNITELQKLYFQTRPFAPETIWPRFKGFIYDPESKSRLLSLTIYTISLIALIFVVKPIDSNNIYSIIDNFDIEEFTLNMGMALLLISIGYFIFMLPIAIAMGYIITPIMRKFNHSGLTLNYFTHELAKYAFQDTTSISNRKIVERFQASPSREIS